MGSPVTSTLLYLKKGVRIQALVQEVSLPSLTGMQPKVQLNVIPVEGTIRHIRSDKPNPTSAELVILIDLDPEADAAYEGSKIDLQCECRRPHVPVKPHHVRGTVGEPIPPSEATLIIEYKE